MPWKLEISNKEIVGRQILESLCQMELTMVVCEDEKGEQVLLNVGPESDCGANWRDDVWMRCPLVEVIDDFLKHYDGELEPCLPLLESLKAAVSRIEDWRDAVDAAGSD